MTPGVGVMLRTLHLHRRSGAEHMYVHAIDSPNYAGVVFTYRHRSKSFSVHKEVPKYDQKDGVVVDYWSFFMGMLNDEVQFRVAELSRRFDHPSDWYEYGAAWKTKVKRLFEPWDFNPEQWAMVDSEKG